ncbi:MAG: peptidoglycan DD-metalloendopeptidase family protein [Lachnospiraceae bacterium]|nr:peptidoglycan DD-metalloendopeptidase family protein [Lachnospiraceae bacterium]
MNKMESFFRSKGFYIALGVGVVALIALITVYSYRSNREALTDKQAIDLDQPIISDNDEESVVTNVEPKKNDNDVAGSTDAAKNDKKNDSTDKDDTDKDNTEKKESSDTSLQYDETANNDKDVSDEEVAAVTSDGTIVADGVELQVSLAYDGEQSLVWPLNGNVILPFSMDTTVYFQTLDAYRCNRGMLIQGAEGDNVSAAYEGVVTSIEETKEFGTVVKVDMGNGYEATYGQLMNVCVAVGDAVSVGQNIAEIGPVSSYYTKEGPHLYFEITKDGVPVNPISLIR